MWDKSFLKKSACPPTPKKILLKGFWAGVPQRRALHTLLWEAGKWEMWKTFLSSTTGSIGRYSCIWWGRQPHWSTGTTVRRSVIVLQITWQLMMLLPLDRSCYRSVFSGKVKPLGRHKDTELMLFIEPTSKGEDGKLLRQEFTSVTNITSIVELSQTKLNCK